MSEDKQQAVKQQARWGVQIFGISLFVGLVVLDAFLVDWELDWIAKVIVGGFALGASWEAVAGVLGIGKKQ